MLLTRDATEAEDLVQETYFCAIPRVASLRVGSNLKSWLLAILRNIWLEQLRCGGVAPKIVAFEMYKPSEYLHASDVSQLEHDRMRDAIQRLPVEFREIIPLRESKSCPLGKSPRS
jgi:RNA polymerase sigma-70 factor (ECF subfamily)